MQRGGHEMFLNKKLENIVNNIVVGTSFFIILVLIGLLINEFLLS